MANCNLRFMDNQKIESSNLTITNEDSNFPFSNALGDIRSRIFKTTSNSAWRLVVDLGFPDKINSLMIFAALGDAIGITNEATIKLEADNVADWASPEYTETISLSDENSLVHFTSSDSLYYRYWSVYIDDPTNPDIINFAYIYLGDYTTTSLRNISNGFRWVTNDRTIVTKSMDGTPYFDVRTKYDSFEGIEYGYVLNEDRILLEDLFDRIGLSTWMPIAIDPEGKTTSGDFAKLTRLARFNSALNRDHRIAEYYGVSFSLEEVI